MVLLNSLRGRPFGVGLVQQFVARAWEGRPTLLFGFGATALVASIVLGGGTHGGFLSDSILELLSIPAFLISLSSLAATQWTEQSSHLKWALMLCLAIAIVPLNQLVPLPPPLWTRLPHRDEIINVFNLIGREKPWLPISVSPSSTWVSVISLLPPLAVFLTVVQLGYRERRTISLIFVGVGVFDACIGLIQVLQGPASPLRFFKVTSAVESVGFFANKNHFAALIYVLFLFCAAWTTQLAFSTKPWTDRKNLETSSIAGLTASVLGLLILIAIEATTKSRAGLALMIVAVFGAIALPMADPRRPAGLSKLKLLAGSAILIFVLLVQFGLYRMFDRFAVDPLQDARIVIARNTITAAEAYMPFGSGVGTFVSVYPNFEQARDAISNVYVNHAHNDFLEVWLEGGVVSAGLVLGFLIFLVWRSARIWWSPSIEARSLDFLLARAATIAIPLILAHSLVDYPLRTGAMMGVFALLCGLLVEPLQLVAKQFKPERAAVREAIAPAREISAEERRRLARLKGLSVAEDSSDLPEGPGLLGSRNEPMVEEEIIEAHSFAETPDIPVDLDEIAGQVQVSAAGPDEISDRKHFAVSRGAGPEPSAADSAPNRAPNSTGQRSTQGPERASRAAYYLEGLNDLSPALVERGGAAGAGAGPGAGSFEGLSRAELIAAAQTRMKVLNIAKPSGISAEQEALGRGPGPNDAQRFSDGSIENPDVPLDPERRRERVLLSIDRFRDTAGLTEPPALEPAAGEPATPEASEPIGDHDVLEQAITARHTSFSGPGHEEDAAPNELLTPPTIAASDGETAAPDSMIDDLLPSATDGNSPVSVATGELAQLQSEKDEGSSRLGSDGGEPVKSFESAPSSDRSARTQPTQVAEQRLTIPDSVPDEASSSGEPSVDVTEWPEQWPRDTGTIAPHEGGPRVGHEEVPLAADVSSVDSFSEVKRPIRAQNEPSQLEPRKAGGKTPQRPGESRDDRLPVSVRSPAGGADATAIPTEARWGENIEWPDEWQK